MTMGGLFAGIGGFELAAHWAGIEPLWSNEIDPYCCNVLRKNFKHEIIEADIRTLGKHNLKAVDVITGGFPCQPFSVAGQRKGKEDDRYLWEEMLRVIATIKPAFVVGENVTGIIGMALDTVLSDLEAQNYITETFIIPACGKNAWHRRDRVWIVAYANGIRWEDEQKERSEFIHNGKRNNTIEEQSRKFEQCRISESSSIFSDTESKFSNERENGNDTEQGKIQLQTGGSNSVSTNTNNTGREEQREQFTDGKKFFAPQCSSWWETEPGMGRVVNGLSGRVDRLKGLGNAIVPQIAYEIFQAVEMSINKK